MLTTLHQTGAIDDVHRAVSALDVAQTEKRDEGKRIVEALGALKYEVLHDRVMTYVALPVPLGIWLRREAGTNWIGTRK